MSAEPLHDPGLLDTWLRARGRQELAPDPAAVERIGATVDAAFARRTSAGPSPSGARIAREAARATVHAGRAGGGGTAERARRARRARPFVAAAFAAVLTAGSIAGPAWVFASASGPGQPLYTVRIAAESIGLPAEGTEARVTAEVARVERRVSEVREEASAGDWQGAVAALAATRAAGRDLDRAIAAAPAAGRAAEPRLRDARQALRVVARDARAPRAVRDEAWQAAKWLWSQRPGHRSPWRP